VQVHLVARASDLRFGLLATETRAFVRGRGWAARSLTRSSCRFRPRCWGMSGRVGSTT